MMCELCNDIKALIYDKTFGYHPPENVCQIVKDEEDGSFHLWDDGGGDSFVAGISEEFANIMYCPKCGRKLKES